MFSIEVKCTIGGREVSAEKFASTFLEKAVRATIDDAIPKLARIEDPSPSAPPLPQKPQVKPRVVSVEETAKTLGLKPSTIRAWIGARKIDSVHLGRRVMIPVEAIDDLQERGFIPARKQG
jgi:excisionase family DNA binding protein